MGWLWITKLHRNSFPPKWDHCPLPICRYVGIHQQGHTDHLNFRYHSYHELDWPMLQKPIKGYFNTIHIFHWPSTNNTFIFRGLSPWLRLLFQFVESVHRQTSDLSSSYQRDRPLMTDNKHVDVFTCELFFSHSDKVFKYRSAMQSSKKTNPWRQVRRSAESLMS